MVWGDVSLKSFPSHEMIHTLNALIRPFEKDDVWAWAYRFGDSHLSHLLLVLALLRF